MFIFIIRLFNNNNIFVNEDYKDPFRVILPGRIPIGGVAGQGQYDQNDFFTNMPLLEEIILHDVEQINLRNIFQNNTELKHIELPRLQTIPMLPNFRNLLKLKTIFLNNVQTINIRLLNPFQGCTNLEIIKLTSLQIIDNPIFSNLGRFFAIEKRLSNVTLPQRPWRAFFK